MFQFNMYDSPTPLRFVLCGIDEKPICELNGIDISTAIITVKANNQYALSFDYNKYIDGETISNGYYQLIVGMKILVEKVGYFRIDYPPYKYSGDNEKLSVSAISIDCELVDKDLTNFKINTGEEDSLEYLVTYDEDETEPLLDGYTGLPYDYILLYNTLDEQLQQYEGKYENKIYTDQDVIDDIVSLCQLVPRMKNVVLSYEVTEQDEEGNERTVTKTSLVEYIIFTKDEKGNVVQVELLDFENRLQTLIDFYKKYRKQLSFLDLAIEKCSCSWSIGEVEDTIRNKKIQVSIDNGTNIYSLLTQDVANDIKCLFDFDLFDKKINVKQVDNIGEETGVFLTKDRLLETLEVNCDSNSVYTRFNVSGGENLNLKQVNYGQSRIENLEYFLNAKDENGNLIYVTDDLKRKYEQYTECKNRVRDYYVSLSKEYNQYQIDIDKIMYKYPDDLKTGWSTYTEEELIGLRTEYKNMLATLQSLYKEDYGNLGCHEDGSIDEEYIKGTEYYFDYQIYQNVLVQIQEALNALHRGSIYSDIREKDYPEIYKAINAYQTQWDLYGISELQAKIQSYKNKMETLKQAGSVILGSDGKVLSWEELDAVDQNAIGNDKGKYEIYYNTYKELEDYCDPNNTESCQYYLNELKVKSELLTSQQNIVDNKRVSLNKLMLIENFVFSELYNLTNSNVNYTDMVENGVIDDKFTDEEIRVINMLYKDKDYNNNNIFSTSIDDSVTSLDNALELLADAEEQLSIESQPQIKVSAAIENILAMPEFKDYDFTVYNYVTVEYQDHKFVNLRLASIEFNPCIPSDSPKITFTNFITSNVESSDTAYLLGSSQSSGSSSSSSGGSGSSNGVYGQDDNIDITISNTMLSKLLNTEMFGTRVSNIILDTLDVNAITARTATFTGLYNGTTKINGGCISTGSILSSAMSNGKPVTNINLDNGTFSFCNGLLTGIYDSTYDTYTLNVDGILKAGSGSTIGGFTIYDAYMSTNNASYSSPKGNSVSIGSSGITCGTVFRVSNDGTVTATRANIKGNLTANTLSTGNRTSSNTGTSGTFIDGTGAIYVGEDNLFTVSADGKITAKSGTIGGFDITENYLSTNSCNTLGGKENSVYISNSGLSCGKKFTVNADGDLVSTNATITGSVTANYLKGSMLRMYNTVVTVDDEDEYGNVITTEANVSGNMARLRSYKTSGAGEVWYELLLGLKRNTYLDYNSNEGQQTDKHHFIATRVQGEFRATTINIGCGTIYGGNGYSNESSTNEISSSPIVRATTSTTSFGTSSLRNTYLQGLNVYLRCGEGGNINTNSSISLVSDENLKNLYELDDRYEGFFMKLNPLSYTYKNTDCTNYHRKHMGFGARAVKQALDESEISTEDFGGLVIQKDVTLTKEDGYNEPQQLDELYSLRYEEFIALNTHMIQKLYKRIESLETQVTELKERLGE